MGRKLRVFISIYFSDSLVNNRKKRDLTIVFDPNDNLYKRCKNLGSSQIKKIIGINSYSDLIKKARAEDRTLGNYIKRKLRGSLIDGKKNPSC